MFSFHCRRMMAELIECVENMAYADDPTGAASDNGMRSCAESMVQPG